MTSDDRRQILIGTGEALYGPRWKTALAQDLRVGYKTISRWSSGAWDVPPLVEYELRGLLMMRGAAIRDLLERMDATTAPPSCSAPARTP